MRDIHHADVRIFGAISAMIGLGMIAGTQGVRRFARQTTHSPRHVVVFSLAVIASGIMLMGSTSSTIATGAGAFVMGAGVGLLMVPAQTLIQSETPLPIVGRVSSGVMSLISVAQILGLSLSGVSAAAIGLRTLFFSSAVLLAGLALAGYAKLRQANRTHRAASQRLSPKHGRQTSFNLRRDQAGFIQINYMSSIL